MHRYFTTTTFTNSHCGRVLVRPEVMFKKLLNNNKKYLHHDYFYFPEEKGEAKGIKSKPTILF